MNLEVVSAESPRLVLRLSRLALLYTENLSGFLQAGEES